MADELDIMRQISELLGSLEEEERSRVLGWANSKFGSAVVAANKKATSSSGSPGDAPDPALEGKYSDFADLYHAALPPDNAARALIAAYWVSVTTDGEPFQSQPLNALLKDLGFHVGNITDALSQCMRAKPALIVQMRKAGNSKQARKTYKITDAGKRRVLQMITGTEAHE